MESKKAKFIETEIISRGRIWVVGMERCLVKGYKLSVKRWVNSEDLVYHILDPVAIQAHLILLCFADTGSFRN